MKLVVAGEYAVLEPGSSGIVAAVDRYATCTARAVARGADVVIAAPTLGADVVQRAAAPGADGALTFEPAGPDVERKLVVARFSATAAYAYAAALGLPLRSLSIVCETEGSQVAHAVTGERVKLGLGSSAAACVAVIGAVLAAHGVAIDRKTFRASILKLALLAHGRAQGGRGSGIDVAAAMHGGLLEYARHDPKALPSADRSLVDLVRGPWPGLSLEPLPIPRGMRLLCGFTGVPASTTDMIGRIEDWKRERPAEHDSFVRASLRAVRGLSMALKRSDVQLILKQVGDARRALVLLGERAEAPIETPALARLADIAIEAGGVGKLSGAGGGDCGIALAFDEPTARRIEEGWLAAGITPIAIAIPDGGMQEMAAS